MRAVWLLVLSMGVGAGAQEPPEAVAAPAVHYVETEFWVPAPGAFPRGLDAVEVYASGPGRHPLAVLTHGTSDKEEEREHVTPWSQEGQALWFARRGYVAIVIARRGYGRSGGERDGTHGGCGSRGSFEEAGEASAADLRAVVMYAATLPEVDAETVVSVGVSTGGFAQVALSGDPPRGLKAAINFAGGRGGDGKEHNCDLGGLVSGFGAFGKQARKHGQVPMLWIYAENDHWFPPLMARQFEAAYVKGGGVEEFVLAPPDGEDGHHLYGHVSVWSPVVEGFLKEKALLPLGDEVLAAPRAPKVPAPAGLKTGGEEAWERYLLGAPYKAFATNGRGGWGVMQGAFDQVLADRSAVERCGKAIGGNGTCVVVARTPGVR